MKNVILLFALLTGCILMTPVAHAQKIGVLGKNTYGQWGDGTTADKTVPTQVGTATNWKQFDGGEAFTVVIKTDGTLCAWGDNSLVQLGDGTYIDKTSPIQIGTTIVQVYDPGEAYLVGGGNIAPTLPAGVYAPDNGKPMNIGFDVQFNSKGVISRGYTTILVRKTVNGDLRLLEIASTNITRVVVNMNNPAALTGAFHGIATLSDITNPGSPVLLESSLDLIISITDRGLPGTGDGIAIILKKGANLYSSATGSLSLTRQLNLVSGDLIVHSSFNIGGEITDGIGDFATGTEPGISIRAYPNPSPGMVNFMIGVDRSSMITLDILSMEGKMVSRLFEGYILNTAPKTIHYDSKLPQGIYFYRLCSSDGVAWGKIVITATY